MSDKFLGSGGSNSTNLINGTVSFYGASLGAESLQPGLPVKANSLRQLITSKLNISDVSGLQTALSDTGIKNPLTSNLNIGVWDIINLPDGKTLRSVTDEIGTFNTSIAALQEKTVNITSASFPTTTTMQGILTLDNLKTNDITDILETSRIALNVGGIDITSANLNFNGDAVVSTPFPSLLEATSFVKTGGTNIQYLMANGSTLTASANSGNSNFYLYTSSTNGSITPASGLITYNNAVQSNATIIYISHNSRDNIDIEVFFKQLSLSSDVYIQDQTNSENFIQYNITGIPIITIGAQVEIPVIIRSSAGTGTTNFPNGHNILLSFFTNTLEIDTRISNVESKTQNQSAVAGTTTMTGNLDVTTRLKTPLLTDIGVGTAQIFLTPGLVEIVASTLQFNNEDVVYNNFPTQLVAQSFRKSGAVSDEFLKGDGSSDINAYTNIQYLMTTAPATISNTSVETQIIGTGLNSNNMSMTWTDGLNYSREIYISGMIKYLANATLTVRFRFVGGTIKIPWVISLPSVAQGPTMIPFIMRINYTIFTPNLYVSSCMLCMAGVVNTSSFMFNNSQACILINANRTVSIQWGAASSSNQFTVTEFIVKNNYIG